MPYKNKEDKNRWFRENRIKLKEQNKCPRCYRPLTDGAYAKHYCINCIEATTETKKIWREMKIGDN